MSNGIDDKFINELKTKCTLVDIISSYVPLKKQSGHYMACCPFHNEKTPSFVINEQQGYYHCFGCGESGDVISFVMGMESVTFIEAVKILAERAGMEVPEFTASQFTPKEKEHKEVLKNIMKDVARYYYSNIVNEEKGKEAREYLASRGIGEETIKRYGIGVSLDYDGMVTYMRRKETSLKDLQECSLINDTEKPIDFYANRIIIPIINGNGDVVGFGGRIYHGEQDAAKYKNSKNTTLFDKSNIIYGINYIRKDKKAMGMSYKNVILVEGYMDVISLGAAGIKNVVACMGTALTEGQAREIVRIAKEVYVCYDGDEAGKKAAIKNIDTLASAGADVKVVSLDSEHKDADEVIRAGGAELFKEKLNAALPIIDYKLKVCKEAFDLGSTDGRAKYVKSALRVLDKIDSKSEREVYLKEVSENAKVSIETLNSELKPIKAPKKQTEKDLGKDFVVGVDAGQKALIASRFVINRIMHNANYVVFSNINKDWFIKDIHKKIYDYAILQPVGTFNVSNMFTELGYDEKEISDIFDINMSFKDQSLESGYYQDSLSIIANRFLQEKLDAALAEYEHTSDANLKKELILQISKLKKQVMSKDIKDKL